MNSRMNGKRARHTTNEKLKPEKAMPCTQVRRLMLLSFNPFSRLGSLCGHRATSLGVRRDAAWMSDAQRHPCQPQIEIPKLKYLHTCLQKIKVSSGGARDEDEPTCDLSVGLVLHSEERARYACTTLSGRTGLDASRPLH